MILANCLLWTCLAHLGLISGGLASTETRAYKFREKDYTLVLAKPSNELTKEQLLEELDTMMNRLNPNGVSYDRLHATKQEEIPQRVARILLRARDKSQMLTHNLKVEQILRLNSIKSDQCNEAEFNGRKDICLTLSDYLPLSAFCKRANRDSKIFCKDKADEYMKDVVAPEQKILVKKFAPTDKLFQKLAFIYGKHNPAVKKYDDLKSWQGEAIRKDVVDALKETKKSSQVIAGLNVGEILELSSIERSQCTKEELDRRQSICKRLRVRHSLDVYCKKSIEKATEDCKRFMVAKSKNTWWKNPIKYIAGHLKGR